MSFAPSLSAPEHSPLSTEYVENHQSPPIVPLTLEQHHRATMEKANLKPDDSGPGETRNNKPLPTLGGYGQNLSVPRRCRVGGLGTGGTGQDHLTGPNDGFCQIAARLKKEGRWS
ncbi:hypothetical protein HYALB_00011101 [Hymenoscyphus albidus]|uniref:Uncharacterized protein n=1 Tax=Hymenoscyphus albidus TaxID=595503 RepID=A0A9N9PXE6_9HELO|nr:hypothetical protein HYALB_00011101 [Hymenoscyphus albidus]